MNKLYTLLVILGPTTTGKTDLALSLAKKFNGELVSADSRQVYKGLDIGTGKIPNQLTFDSGSLTKGNIFWEIDGIKVWMYDVVSPRVQYTVADYVKDATEVIREIQGRGRLPILVGGSGLYIKALLYGLSNLNIPADKKLRTKLEKLAVLQLQNKLKSISHTKWQSLNYSDKQNPRRLVRAIEIAIMSLRGVKGSPKGSGNLLWNGKIATLIARDDVFKIGLIANRKILYQRSDERIVSRINQGMIDEAKKLYKNGLSFKRMQQLGLEYGVLADFLTGQIQTKDELIRILQGKIHSFVRRQLTWFKKEKNINWFDITDENYPIKVENLITKWYDSSYA